MGTNLEEKQLNKIVNFPPSGEVGFRAMSESLGWAKRPMLQRVHLLPPSMPVTMLYGARSWVDSSSGERVAQIRKQAHTEVLVSSNYGRAPSSTPVSLSLYLFVLYCSLLVLMSSVCPLRR